MVVAVGLIADESDGAVADAVPQSVVLDVPAEADDDVAAGDQGDGAGGVVAAGELGPELDADQDAGLVPGQLLGGEPVPDS